jgi:hypothetical protein
MWIALILLVFSHVFVFCLGVVAYHMLRWLNMMPLLAGKAAQKQVNEQQLTAMADKIARQQVQKEQFSWMGRFQPPVASREVEDVQEDQSKFSGPAPKKQ